MTIKEFCESYRSDSVEKIIQNNYISYGTKMLKARAIVEQTSHNHTTGEFEMNTPMRNMLFNKMLIESYTPLTFTEGDGQAMLDEYDMLNRGGIIEEIINAIPQREYAEYKTILEQSTNDMLITIKNNNSLGGMMQSMTPLLDQLATLPPAEE